MRQEYLAIAAAAALALASCRGVSNDGQTGLNTPRPKPKAFETTIITDAPSDDCIDEDPTLVPTIREQVTKGGRVVAIRRIYLRDPNRLDFGKYDLSLQPNTITREFLNSVFCDYDESRNPKIVLTLWKTNP